MKYFAFGPSIKYDVAYKFLIYDRHNILQD